MLRCERCFKDKLVPFSYNESERTCAVCGSGCAELLVPAIVRGKPVMTQSPDSQIRDYVLEQMKGFRRRDNSA